MIRLVAFGISVLALTVSVSALEYCEPQPVVAAAPSTQPAAPKLPPPPPTRFDPIVADGVGPRLVFVGDSLTRGAGVTEVVERYPAVTAGMFADGARAFSIYALSGMGSSIITDLFQLETIEDDAVVVVWIGRNSYRRPEVVISDVAEMVSFLNDRRFLVLGIIAGRYVGEQPGEPGRQIIDELNARLAAKYPLNYVNVESALLCDDRADNIHLNAAGQKKVAEAVFEALEQRGW